MNAKPKPFEVVSSGTLRDSDLLESILDVLEYYRPKKCAELIKQGRGYLAKYGDFGYLSYLYNDLDEENESTNDLDELDWLINEELFNAMQDISPANCSYGAHFGDGAVFGFWPDEDSPLWE